MTEQRERLAAMTPAERVALAVRLSEQGLASYYLHDAAALLALVDRARVVADVEARLGEVRPDVQSLWRDLLSR